MKKLLLLVVLFLSGCSTSNLIEFIGGKRGAYSDTDGEDQTFTISNDGSIYLDTEAHKLNYETSNDTDCITFKGYNNSGVAVTIVLSGITSNNGIRTMYYDHIKRHETGFMWVVSTSN